MRETNSKNKINRPKNHFLGAVRGLNGAEKSRPQKAHLRHLLNVHTQFQLPNSISRENRGGTTPF